MIKKKNSDVPRIQCKGRCMERRACLAQFYKKFFLGSRLLDLERNHCFVSSCFSLISFGCVFLGIAAIVHGLSFGYDTGFGERGGRMGVVWVEASVVMWNKSHYLSGVAAAAL